MADQSPLPLSIFIIARDEADRIGATIVAVRSLTDDLVVVDSASKDATRQVAASLGARVIVNEWPGYGPQKRFAEDQCRHNWVLNIDADEVVPPDLAAEIRALFAPGQPPADGYEIRIAEIFPGEGRPHRLAYSLAPVRLYRRDRGRYVDSRVHDRVAFVADAKIGRLKGIVHHFSVRSLGDQIIQLNAFAEQQADHHGVPALVPQGLLRQAALRPRHIWGHDGREFRLFPLAPRRQARREAASGRQMTIRRVDPNVSVSPRPQCRPSMTTITS
jgi:glycosyltransferase involved in cell wall biosynthesis